MKTKSLFKLSAVVLLALTATVTIHAIQVKVSDAEVKLLTTINSTTDAEAKLTLAEEFVKKYPKSGAMPQLAEQVALEIARVADQNQKLLLADRYEKSFTDEKGLLQIKFARMDAYVAQNKLDEAYALAAKILEKNPEELHTMVQMTLWGTEAIKKGNSKYATQTKQYGLKAITLIESGTKPASTDDATWAADKAQLPLLYQQTALLSLMMGDAADAKTRLSKAVSLAPKDPTNHAFMGYIINNEYVQQATTYKSMPEGKQKEEMLKKVESMLDTIIDEFAQAVALATGRSEYQPLLQQLTPDLTSYYKYRHNQSVEGLQQLVDKYKPQP
jgi:tetratricopeptide (TPR) repeat protein